MEKNNNIVYGASVNPKLDLASIPRRAVAMVVDGIIFHLIYATLMFAYILFLRDQLFNGSGSLEGLMYYIVIYGGAVMAPFFCSLTVPMLYFGYCESSNWQATPGKKLLNLKVVDLDGKRLSFIRASGRIIFAESFVLLFFGLPIVCSLAFYRYLDVHLPAWVFSQVSILLSIAGAIGLVAVFFTKNKQTLFDIVTRRVVVNAEPEKVSKTLPAEGNLNSSSIFGSIVTPKNVTIAVIAAPFLLYSSVYGLTMWNDYSHPETSQEFERKKKDYEAKMNVKGPVVYCIKDVSKGEIIYGRHIEQKDIKQSKIPHYAIASSEVALGRVAKYDLHQGVIVVEQDLEPGPSIYSIKVDLGKSSMKQFLDMGCDDKIAAEWIKERMKLEKEKEKQEE